jgi:ATP-dependent Clp protease ATP-binding subunit ClpC
MESELFTNKATFHFRNVIAQAFHHAALGGTKVVTPLHLLLALVAETGSIGEEIVRRAGVRPDMVLVVIALAEVIPLNRSAILSPSSKRAIEKAVMRAARDNHSYIGTEHLLFGLLEAALPEIEVVLNNPSVKIKELTQQLEIALKSAGKLPEMLFQIWGENQVKQTWKGAPDKSKKMPALEYFGNELTNEAHAAKLDPVIGRDEEIERMIHILARRTKNNPLLLGEPGVGKTAIVEGLAKRVLSGQVPPQLLGKRIFAVDLGLMIAGTMYRGEFESRIKQLVDEVKANPDIILFIDEIHSIVGAGSSNGTLDAANLLKPALARGELRVIGATTFDEFKKHIEHDAALERRFQTVSVREPSTEETVEILTHIKGHYERFHGISVGPEAVQTAVMLAHKYFPEKRFPDKAIDLLDEAMSAVKVQTANVTTAELQSQLKQSLKEIAIKKQKAIVKESYEEAQKLKAEEQQVALQLGAILDDQKNAAPRGAVTSQDIHAVIERILRRPISERATAEPKESLHAFLSARVFGQDEVLTTVSHALTKARLGLHEETRPLASFLFVGSSGVGKTELAKLIATGVYGDPKALIRLDMTEFSEGFSVSKMMGSPAGYVGYREGTTIVDRLRRQPMSVLLFDEIDKAHPDVLNILLQMLEEGRIADASGKEASVKQAIIILTYQIAPEEITGSSFGFSSDTVTRSSDSVRATLFNSLKPELLNRIDNVCVFQPLSHDSLIKIAVKQLNDFTTRLLKRSIVLNWDETVPELITTKSSDTKEGARKVRHIIENSIEQNLVAHLSLNPTTTEYRITTKNDILGVEPIYATVRGRVAPKKSKQLLKRPVKTKLRG